MIRWLWDNPVVTAVTSVLDRRIIETAVALYSVQAMNYILPLVTIPYLARVLGPGPWGELMFVMSIAAFVHMVINYSFELSATRDVAQQRGDPDAISRTVAGVLGARLVLTVGILVVIGIAQLVSTTLADLGWLLWLGVYWFVAMGFHPFWFYLGIERVRAAVTIDVIIRAIAAGLVILLVNAPGDAWLVFTLQGTGTMLAMIVTTIMIYRHVPFRLPDLRLTIDTLKSGAGLFIFRASTGLYAMSNTIILGFVSAPAAVAFYSAGERIQRITTTVLQTITNAMFPRASMLAKSNPQQAARLARVSTFTMFALALVGVGILYLLAPWIVLIILGSGYEEVVPVLRILFLVVLLHSINIPIGHHWLIPNGYDGLLTKITATAGVIHIPVAIFLAMQYAHIGVAWALVGAEAIIMVLLIVIPLIKGIGPFRMPLRDSGTLTSTPMESVNS